MYICYLMNSKNELNAKMKKYALGEDQIQDYKTHMLDNVNKAINFLRLILYWHGGECRTGKFL